MSLNPITRRLAELNVVDTKLKIIADIEVGLKIIENISLHISLQMKEARLKIMKYMPNSIMPNSIENI